MWNTTEFGNPGGYAQSSGGFFNTTTASPSSVEKKKPDRLNNIIPCTIAQIWQVPENEEALKVGSLTAKMVTFVGLVHTIDSQSTKASYMISDSTGPSIEVQVWFAENVEMEKRLRCIQENTYVRVTGNPRFMKGKRYILGLKIRPVTDANEITTHILEVMHSTKTILEMDNEPSGMASNFSATGGIFDKHDSTASNPFGAASENVAYQGLSKPQRLVLQFISACSDQQGINIHDIYNNMKSLNRPAIKDAIEFLTGEGHIYSTIDDEHFKSTAE